MLLKEVVPELGQCPVGVGLHSLLSVSRDDEAVAATQAVSPRPTRTVADRRNRRVVRTSERIGRMSGATAADMQTLR